MSEPFEPNGDNSEHEFETPQSQRPEPKRPVPNPGNVIDRAALEQALQETIDAASSGTPIDPVEMKAIRQAAARHKSEQVTIDIAADLIQAVLVTHYRALRAGESFWQTISREIARTLCDDPTAEARLQTLWQRLRKEGA